MRLNKATPAICMIFLGMLMQNLPGDSWKLTLAGVVAGIFVIIGVCRLAGCVDGYGQTGAYLLLAATILGILIAPFKIVSDGGTLLNTFSVPHDFSGFQMLDFIFLLRAALWFACFVCWWLYPPFKQMAGGIIVMLVASVLSVAKELTGVLSDPTSLMIDRPLEWGICILSVVGYLLMALNINAVIPEVNRKTRSLILMAAGMLYSLIILTDNGYLNIVVSLIGTIVWMVTSSQLASRSGDRTGTGGFTTFGILMLVALVFHLLPDGLVVGAIISACLQVAAFIVLGNSLGKFHSNSVFNGKPHCGMKTLSVIAYVFAALSVIFAFPSGEAISAVVYCLVGLPLIMVGWNNGIRCQSDVQAAVDASFLTTPEPVISTTPPYIKETPVPSPAPSWQNVQHPPQPVPAKSNGVPLWIIAVAAGGLIVLGGIGWAGYTFIIKPGDTIKQAIVNLSGADDAEVEKAIAGIVTTEPEQPVVTEDTPVEKVVEKTVVAEETEMEKPATTTSSEKESKEFTYGVYSGEMLGGQPHGEGTMRYTQRHQLSRHDRQKRTAEAGESVKGQWHKGELTSGTLYDKNGNQKTKLIIGRSE